MKYHLVETGGTGGINGGIMKPQKGPWPGKLAFYIDVEDLGVYERKIKQAGGKILVGWTGPGPVEAAEVARRSGRGSEVLSRLVNSRAKRAAEPSTELLRCWSGRRRSASP